MSDMDFVKGFDDENIVPDLNSSQESERSAILTKTAEAKTGKVLYDVVFRQTEKEEVAK